MFPLELKAQNFTLENILHIGSLVFVLWLKGSSYFFSNVVQYCYPVMYTDNPPFLIAVFFTLSLSFTSSFKCVAQIYNLLFLAGFKLEINVYY